MEIYGADFVTIEEGTGVVHIAPAFGEDDMEIGKKHNLPFIQHIGMDGKFKPEVRDFAGLPVKPKEKPQATDIEIIKWLDKNNKLFLKKSFVHSYPFCWRCDTPLLNYAASSWFVRVTEIKERMIKNNKKINWVPSHLKEGRFGKWLEGVRDWAISRSRFWGAPLPVWKCENCGKIKPAGSIDDIKKFEINDDCFNIDLERAEKICDLIIGENLGVKYELYNGMRADRVTERLLQKMKDSGCIFISYGCESGNQGVINNMGKALKIEKVREAVELTNKVGIRNSINFIIGNKGETYASAMESIALAQALPTNFVNFYNIIPYPGTELFDWATKHAAHMIPVNEYLGKVGSRDLTPVFDTEEFPAVQRAKALKKGYALYEKTVLQFRLGKIAGYLAYIISRNRKLFSIGRKLALSNKIGFYIYSLLSYRSRKS